MGGACSTYEGGEVVTGFWWGNLREGGHLEDPGIDGRIIFKRIFKKWVGGMDQIDLAQNRDRCGGGVLVSAAVNFGVPSNGISCLVENLLASPEGLCCMDVS
jgi:hypothetical protein